MRVEVPPPSEIVYAAEAAEIREAALAFLAMEVEARQGTEPGTWTHLEFAFGHGERGEHVVDERRERLVELGHFARGLVQHRRQVEPFR